MNNTTYNNKVDYDYYECVCPRCGEIYQKRMPIYLADKPEIYKENGYIVETCINCGNDNVYAKTICPDCLTKTTASLPIGFITSKHLWMMDGYIVLLCYDCRDKNSRVKRTNHHSKELIELSKNNKGLCPEDNKLKCKEPTSKEMANNLRHAFSKEVWNMVNDEIKGQQNGQ